MASRTARKEGLRGLPWAFGAGRYDRRRGHSPSQRSVGYGFLIGDSVRNHPNPHLYQTGSKSAYARAEPVAALREAENPSTRRKLLSIAQRTPIRWVIAEDDLLQTGSFHHPTDLVPGVPLLQPRAEPIQRVGPQDVEIPVPVKRQRNGIDVKAELLQQQREPGERQV